MGDKHGKSVYYIFLILLNHSHNYCNNQRLRREISVWAALSHPNIVEFYGYATGLSDFPVMVSKVCTTIPQIFPGTNSS